jgi:antitoxin component of RelBE/YafQ-DinJ toxin-antitoxin module
MIKQIGQIHDVIVKHYKILILAFVILILTVWSLPNVRDSLLSSLGVGTYKQQLIVSENIAGIENDLKKNTDLSNELNNTINDIMHFQLMNIITNNELPIHLRLDAYDKYIALGYNSWIQTYYENEIKPLAQDVMNYRLNKVR